VALADAADGRVAGEDSDGVCLVREEESAGAHPRGGGGGLGAGVASANDNDIEESALVKRRSAEVTFVLCLRPHWA